MHNPTISATSYGHTLNSSVTSCGHPHRVSVPLTLFYLGGLGGGGAKCHRFWISKKKLKMRRKKMFSPFSPGSLCSWEFLRHICQDKSSCDSSFKDAFQVHSFMAPSNPPDRLKRPAKDYHELEPCNITYLVTWESYNDDTLTKFL